MVNHTIELQFIQFIQVCNPFLNSKDEWSGRLPMHNANTEALPWASQLAGLEQDLHLYIPFLSPTQKVGGRLHVVELTCGFSRISWTLRAWHVGNLAVVKKVQHLRRSGQPRPCGPPNLHISKLRFKVRLETWLFHTCWDSGGPSVGVSWIWDFHGGSGRPVSWRQLASVRLSGYLKKPCFDVPSVSWRQLASVRNWESEMIHDRQLASVSVS